jgi:RNA polymerase sigma-70 factor, ECF subfamily
VFEFDRPFSTEGKNIRIVREAAGQTLEQRQRDVYDSHRHRVFSLAYYMTGNEVEAEQILGNTFVRAFQQAEQPDATGVDSSLIEEFHQRFPLHHVEPAAVATPQAALTKENVRRTDLEEAIQFLPANERLVFLLRDVEGYPAAAIAKLLQMPEAQVQRIAFSARIRLRQVLANAGKDEEAAA